MAPPEDKDALIQEFCAFTSANPSEANTTLAAHNWDVEAAVATWFASQEGGDEDIPDAPEDDEPEVEPPQPGGARTLGGDGIPSRYVPPPASTTQGDTGSSLRQAAPARGGGQPARRGVAAARTLRDLQGGGEHAGHGHDDDDDDEGEQQNFFTGGEKSGLAVQNPNAGGGDRNNPRDQIEGLLDRARRNAPRPGGESDEDPAAPPSRFSGRGVTLGGEGTESRVVADPNPRATAASRPERVQRVLHLWSDGFSVDDGDLYRYDDPANAATLAMINQGRAPLELLNVQHNQEVDLQLDNQKDNKFVKPKKAYRPFDGSGQRLGSPTPGASSSSTSQSYSIPTAPAPAAASSAPAPSVDTSQPTVGIQIRLGDGTQLRSRFNTTSTVGELYGFVTASTPQQRAFVLMTTFPSKELTDRNAKLEETELKKGGVVVQKWT